MKLKNSRTTNTGIAVISAISAFVGWGYVMNLTSASAHPKPASVTVKNSPTVQKDGRDMVLSQTKSVKRKEGEKEASVIMNDPFIQNKWGLERTFAKRAWEVSQGSKDIKVAVIDTGVDVNHQDIQPNLWENPGEMGLLDEASCKNQRETSIARQCFADVKFCATQKNALSIDKCNKSRNGLDNDGNGYKNDVHGWNFVSNNHSLTDNHGHGTHIAGIIGAKGGNNFGISGVSPNVSLMILKYYDPKVSNSNNLKNTVQAIRYAIKMGADIINYSGGGTDYSAEEFAAVKEAEKAGILFVAAAGNERSNSDESGKHYYPADYDLTNIISVTAVNKEETRVLPSSNYGVRTVDIAAPGENIYSAMPNNSFGQMTGTSQATAFVSGVAALIMSHNRDFDAAEVKKYVLSTGDEYTTLLSKTGTAKLLNSYKALTTLDKGVGLTGVVASNTAKVGSRAFSSEQNLKDPRFGNVSAFNNTADESEEQTEAIAMFGKDFLKAVEKSRTGTPDLQRR